MISINRLLYKLEQGYGSDVDFYKTSEESVDILTGKRTTNRIKYLIKSAVFLDQGDTFIKPLLRKINPIMRNSGLIEQNNCKLLVAAKKLKNIKPTINDYFIIKGERYDIVSIMLEDEFYYFTLKELKGSILYEIHTRILHDKLTLIHLLKAKHNIFWSRILTDEILIEDTLIINALFNRTLNDNLEFIDELILPTVQNGTNFTTYIGLKDIFELTDNLTDNLVRLQELSDTITFTDEAIRDSVIFFIHQDFVDIDQFIFMPEYPEKVSV